MKILLISIAVFAISQSYSQIVDPNFLNKVVLQVDTATFISTKDTAQYQGSNYMLFNYTKENEICNVKLFPSSKQKIDGKHQITPLLIRS